MTKNEYYDFVMGAVRPAETLVGMVPADKLAWRPGAKFMSLGQLICHVAEGVGDGIRRLVANDWPPPEEMETAMKLENLPACSVAEALAKLEKDKAILREALDGLSEEDFAEKIVFVPWGMQMKMEAMALFFREHFTNHKMQLFLYLKLLDLPVNTTTLYGG